MIFGNGYRDVRGKNMPFPGDTLDSNLPSLRGSLSIDSYSARHVDFLPKADIRVVLVAICAAVVALAYPIDRYATKVREGGYFDDDRGHQIASAITEKVSSYNDEVDGGRDTISTLYKDLLSEKALNLFADVCWRSGRDSDQEWVEVNKILNRAGAMILIINNFTDDNGHALMPSANAERNFIDAANDLIDGGWLNENLVGLTYSQMRSELRSTIKGIQQFEDDPKKFRVEAQKDIMDENDEVITPQPCKGKDIANDGQAKSDVTDNQSLAFS